MIETVYVHQNKIFANLQEFKTQTKTSVLTLMTLAKIT